MSGRCDVAIVGAGPAGLNAHAAELLLHLGNDVGDAQHDHDEAQAAVARKPRSPRQ